MKKSCFFMFLFLWFLSSTLSGQAYHKGFFFNFDICGFDLNGKGLFQENNFDIKRDMALLPNPDINPVYPDDVHTMRGWNWKNHFMMGAVSSIGYRPFSFLSFSVALRTFLPRTETSYVRVNDGNTTYSWEGEMTYSHLNLQTLLHIYPMGRKYVFVTLGWEWAFLDADGWFEASEKTDGSTTSVRSIFQGTGQAMGPVLGGGIDLNMPGDYLQFTISFQYSLIQYKGSSLLSSPDGTGGFPSRSLELGVGGFSLNSGIKVFLTRAS